MRGLIKPSSGLDFNRARRSDHYVGQGLII